MILRLCILVLALALPASAQWRASAGVDFIPTFSEPSISVGGGYDFNRFGVEGLFTHTSETLNSSTVTMKTSEVETWLKIRKKHREQLVRYVRRFDSTFTLVETDAILTTYIAAVGPSVRLATSGASGISCRALFGTVYRAIEGSGDARFSTRTGCGFSYAIDPAASVVVGVDYLFLAPGVHLAPVSVRWLIGF